MTTEPTNYMKSSISSLCAGFSIKMIDEQSSSNDNQSSYDKQSEAPIHMLPPPSETRKNLPCGPDNNFRAEEKTHEHILMLYL